VGTGTGEGISAGYRASFSYKVRLPRIQDAGSQLAWFKVQDGLTSRINTVLLPAQRRYPTERSGRFRAGPHDPVAEVGEDTEGEGSAMWHKRDAWNGSGGILRGRKGWGTCVGCCKKKRIYHENAPPFPAGGIAATGSYSIAKTSMNGRTPRADQNSSVATSIREYSLLDRCINEYSIMGIVR
jgi:hypothetical protein